MENKNPENIRQAVDLISAVVRRIKEEKAKRASIKQKGAAKV